MSKIVITEELKKHVFDYCEKQKRLAEANKDCVIYASYSLEDIKFACDHYTNGERCLTPLEWDQTIAWEGYYEAFKDAEGISPRWTNWKEQTTEEWDEMADDCYKEIYHRNLLERKAI